MLISDAKSLGHTVQHGVRDSNIIIERVDEQTSLMTFAPSVHKVTHKFIKFMTF